MKLDFVSVGEVMIQFNAMTPGPLRTVSTFEKHVAGSEANVMAGLSRLGHRTGMITRVGKDEFGSAILGALKAEDVDTSHVTVDPSSPTGIYFTQRHFPVPGESVLTYYRKGSAASNLDEADIDTDYIKGAKNIHITGITPALSVSCARAVWKAFQFARENGLGISFDTNVRPKLWKDTATARGALSNYLTSKVVLTNGEDLGLLFPGLGMKDAVAEVLRKGAEVVAVKLASAGAYARSGTEEAEAPAFHVPHVEDVIGAGDAFDAAFLSSYLKRTALRECLEHGCAAGALVVTVRGDMEALPRREDLEAFLTSKRWVS